MGNIFPKVSAPKGYGSYLLRERLVFSREERSNGGLETRKLPQLLRKGCIPDYLVVTSWVKPLTRSFLPKMVTLPLICSFLRRHSMEFRPFSMGSEMLQRPMVGVMVPARTWGSLWKLTPIPLAYITLRVPLLQSW